MLKAWEKGEFKSVRAAGIAAGIVKVKAPMQVLKDAWAKCSPSEQYQFVSECLPGVVSRQKKAAGDGGPYQRLNRPRVPLVLKQFLVGRGRVDRVFRL